MITFHLNTLYRTISVVFSVTVCALSFIYTSYILYKLTYFFSNHNDNQKTSLRSYADENLIIPTLWILLVDTCLLSVFMLQHSIMASSIVKNIYSKLHIEYVNRSLYNLTSATALHFLLNKWQFVPWISIWNVDTFYNNTLWLVFVTVHILGWIIIYSGCLIMDISELAGFKQVYYKILARPCPMSMKSKELQRYYEHMRHPSFIGFFIILWIHPFMTIDRLLLASILTIYMALMWAIDEEDYNYCAKTYRSEKIKLSMKRNEGY